MVVQVQKSGDVFSFKLPPQFVQEFALVDGSAIDIKPATTSAGNTIRYATMDEAMKAYRDTLAENEYAYRELAK